MLRTTSNPRALSTAAPFATDFAIDDYADTSALLPQDAIALPRAFR